MVTIIDYKAGNLKSVERSLSHLGITWRIARVPEDLAGAERVLFPGVGHAASAMEHLSSTGMDQALRDFAATGKPFLGICLGSQIVLDHSDEGQTTCLGILQGSVRYFGELFGQQDTATTGGEDHGQNRHGGFLLGTERLKVPHMGWNKAVPDDAEPIARELFAGVSRDASFYFVHSYYTELAGSTHALTRTEYGKSFVSGLCRDNIAALQFHPEKSGEPGLRILTNFSAWRP